MKSAIYKGRVAHCRFLPKIHGFSYFVYMIYLDLDELDHVVNLSWLCSNKRWAPLQFLRKDFHGDESKSVKQCVYDTVKQQTGAVLNGPVRMLSNWRCFGFSFNPLTNYYCFDETGEKLLYVVAEVTNTPWRERHAYVISVENKKLVDNMLEKQFTVSPFNPLNMRYQWRSTIPSQTLFVAIDTLQDNNKYFSASMNMRRINISASTICCTVMRWPVMSVQVVVAIYWQAFLMVLKRIPFLGKDKVTQLSKGSLR